MESPALAVRGLGKRFGGVTAVADLSFSVAPGSITGLIGPNGSGKTTSFNLISGLATPDSGSVQLFGRDIVGKPPHEIVEAGLVRTFQQIRLFPDMTALENVMAARSVRTKAPLYGDLLFLPAARRLRKAEEAKARDLLSRVGVTGRQDVPARRLGFLEQHVVEIARALATEPRILLLDEPSTGMVASEVETLEGLIRDLQAGGITIVIVEHNMRMVMRLCSHVTVMDAGHEIAEGTPAQIAVDPNVIAAYLGEDADGVA